MAQTDAQRRAKLKYVGEHVKQINLRFYPKEAELYEKAHRLGSPGIKKLIEQSK